MLNCSKIKKNILVILIVAHIDEKVISLLAPDQNKPERSNRLPYSFHMILIVSSASYEFLLLK